MTEEINKVPDEPLLTLGKEPTKEIKKKLEKIVIPIAFVSPFIRGAIDNIPLLIPSDKIKLSEVMAACNKMAAKIAATDSPDEDAKKENLKKLELVRETTKALEECLKGFWYEGAYDRIFDNMDEWTQALDLDGKKSGTKHRKISASKDSEGRITNQDDVAARFRQSTGVGRPVTQPLYHSGITVTISNITETSYLRILMILNETNMQTGMNHKGLMFSTDDAKLNCKIVDWVLQHVVDSTLRETTIDNILRVLRVGDIYALIAAANASLYPEGYPFMMSCVTDVCKTDFFKFTDKGTNFERIDYRRVQWYNHTRISPYLFRFVNAPMGTKLVEEVLKCQKDHILKEVETKALSNRPHETQTVSVTMPLYTHYKNVCYEWLSDIESTVNATLEITDSADVDDHIGKRERYVNDSQIRLTLQRTAAWISKATIKYEDEEEADEFVDTPEKIMEAIGAMCGNTEIVGNFITEVESIKMNTALTMTGIPIFNCPKCGEPQNKDDDITPKSLIPLNVAAHFLSIMALRNQDK